MTLTSTRGRVAAIIIALIILSMRPLAVSADSISCEQKDGTLCPGAPLNTPSQDIWKVDERHFTILFAAEDKIQPGDLALCEGSDPTSCKEGSALSDIFRFSCANQDGTNCTGQLYSLAGDGLDSPADVEQLPGLKNPKFFAPEFGSTGVTYLAKGPSGNTVGYVVVSDVPEPGSMLLLGSGCIALIVTARRRLTRNSTTFTLLKAW